MSLDFSVSTKTLWAERIDFFKSEMESFQFVCFRTETLVFFSFNYAGLFLRALTHTYTPPHPTVWLKTLIIIIINKLQILVWSKNDTHPSQSFLAHNFNFNPKFWLCIQLWAGMMLFKNLQNLQSHPSRLQSGDVEEPCGRAGSRAAWAPAQRRSLARVGGGMAEVFSHSSSFLLAAKPMETVSASTEFGQCSGVRPRGGF